MFTRDLDKAKEAFAKKDAEASKAAHMKGQAGASASERHSAGGKYLGSIVYGGLDGTITTFACVAGVAGAGLGPGIVLIMGFANLIADGLSMSIGDYLSTKSEREYERAEREREAWEVDNYPEGEKEELRELYEAKGMSPEDARSVVDLVSKHRDAWVDIMMVEELGIVKSDESPLGSALATFASFATFGFLPLLAYVAASFLPGIGGASFPASVALTGATLFTLGAAKTRITGMSWLKSGMEMLLVGSVAAACAFGIGALLGGLA
jgi:VIT1/CCC1 family predicted Fe2+/Mn2+ transporter